MRPLRITTILIALALFSCGDSTSGAADTADTAVEAAADTLAEPDTSADADEDSGAADTSEPGDTATATDVPTGDATPGCSYLDDRKVAKCHQVWTTVIFWSDWGNPDCPTWWQLGTDTVATLDELGATFECDVDCVLSATIAVDFIDCEGHRNGFEEYAGADGCGEVYGTSGGLYTDLCAWPSYTCHCEEE